MKNNPPFTLTKMTSSSSLQKQQLTKDLLNPPSLLSSVLSGSAEVRLMTYAVLRLSS